MAKTSFATPPNFYLKAIVYKDLLKNGEKCLIILHSWSSLICKEIIAHHEKKPPQRKKVFTKFQEEHNVL